MHTLAGPFNESPVFPMLNNLACHHDNMGHQNLSVEMAEPLVIDMLMCTAEMDRHGHLEGPFIAETNFSNFAFIKNQNFIVFPENNSATYGLTQHMAMKTLNELKQKTGFFEHISGFSHEPVLTSDFTESLKNDAISACFVLRSMPAIRVVQKVTIDETLSGGTVTLFEMDPENASLAELMDLFQIYKELYFLWE